MYSIYHLIAQIIDLYSLCIFIWFVLGLLIQFKVVNRSHPVVYRVEDFLERIIQPALKPIRKFIPPINGIDLSPMVLILALMLIRNLIGELIFGIRSF